VREIIDIKDLVLFDDLWCEAYPYLAAQAVAAYGRVSGSVLELGPFSGGISIELERRCPGMVFTLADDHAGYLQYLERKIARENLSPRMRITSTPLDRLPFDEERFDLVILRGAFFFIMDSPQILKEIYRVLAPGGVALVGGGYGAGIPQEVIERIAPETKAINLRLGQRRVSIDELEKLVESQGLSHATQISEEGGVWLLLRKRVSVAVETPSSLKSALGLAEREVVSLVGGGGKTSLMFTLAHELADSGKRVITTTTTHIIKPSAAESLCVILEENEDTLISRLCGELDRHNHVTVAYISSDGKLKGLPPETVDKIASMHLVDYIINEADGAACRPIKAPRAWEPVIPSCTTLAVAVAGMDALNVPLSSGIAFQTGLITGLTGVPEGGIITAEAISTLLTHERGIIQYVPPSSRIVPFLNKAELAAGEDIEALAAAILSRRHPQIDRVAAASLRDGYKGLRLFKTFQSTESGG
jgi:probable selenium-dependent hydroxylase accessory protein YqeC